MKLIINADGASRGNPGPAAIGATVKDEQGRLLSAISERIGRTTNNQAEYRALIAALREAGRLGATEVAIRLDSELLVCQLTGRYRVKHPALKPLYEETRKLLAVFASVAINHIPRAENAQADSLANAALD